MHVLQTIDEVPSSQTGQTARLVEEGGRPPSRPDDDEQDMTPCNLHSDKTNEITMHNHQGLL